MKFFKKGKFFAVNGFFSNLFAPEFVFIQKMSQNRRQPKSQNKTDRSQNKNLNNIYGNVGHANNWHTILRISLKRSSAPKTTLIK